MSRSEHRNDIPLHFGVLPDRRPNLSHCDQRVPANLFDPFCACHEDEFSDGCAKVGIIMTIQSVADASSITVESLPRLAVGFEFSNPLRFINPLLNNLVVTVSQVSLIDRLPQQISQDLDINTRSSPGLMKLKTTRPKASSLLNSS